MTTIYFTNHQRQPFGNFLKEVSMHYLCKKLECAFQKFTLEENQKYQFINTEIQ